MKQTPQPVVFHSISELVRALGLPKSRHPLIALVNYDVTRVNLDYAGQGILIDFYKISFKQHFHGQVKYGPGYYDFEEGGLAFLAPHQLVTMSGDESSYVGYALYFHPDLIRNYPLGKNIGQYGFFSYAVNEALFLSDKEKHVIAGLFESIATELEHDIDAFSQDVLVSQIGLLLNHSNRFYNRQFLTRKAVHSDLISRMNTYLEDRFTGAVTGIPTVHEVAGHLGTSARYLTDMLRSLTGRSTQEYIQERLIEHAKTILGTTGMNVSEIAYQLGFGHPQSFNRLFKRATRLTPGAFRKTFRSGRAG
jgi:AraC-like DNA-binding protein